MQETLGYSAIGWVHYRLAGGLKQVLIVAGIYAAIVVGVIMFATRISNQASTLVGSALFYNLVTSAIIVLQAIVLIIFGSFRISAAIRLDITSNMMESHRLMPLGGVHAIFGYIVGATTQVWAIALVNLIITAGIAIAGRISLTEALIAHAILFEFAIFFWIITALAALTNRPFLRSVTGVPIMLFLSRTVLSAVFPGIYLFCSPILGTTVFFPGSKFVSQELAWSVAGQFIAGSLCFLAAARKYRQPDKPSLYPWQGIVLLATWVVLTLVDPIGGSAAGATNPADFGEGSRFVATVGLSLVLMIVPLSSAAWFANFHRKNRPKMPIALIELRALGCVLATTLLALLATRIYRPEGSVFDFSRGGLRNLLIMLMPLLGHALAVHFLLRIVHRAGAKFGGLLVFVWVFSIALLPLIGDFFWNVAMQNAAKDWGGIASISPIGTAALLYRNDEPGGLDVTSPVIGAAVPLVLGIGLTVLYYATIKPKRGKSSPEIAKG